MKTFRLVPVLVACIALTACGVGVEDMNDSGDQMGDVDSSLTANSKFETFQGQDGKYYFHLIAGNGEKVLQSQGYTTLTSAKSGITTVKSNGTNPSRFLMREAVDGSNYFVLVGGNGAIIGVSEMYATSTAAQSGAATVQKVIAAVNAQPVAPTTGVRFESFKGLDGKYYFHLRAANGEIVLQSQAYTTSTGATSGISSVKTNGVNSLRYEVLAAADGRSFFHLKAGNGQIIARGQTYASESGAKAGVNSAIDAVNATVTPAR
ncbi:MAG: YegP family protein [Myxococcaceae bacterium]